MSTVPTTRDTLLYRVRIAVDNILQYDYDSNDLTAWYWYVSCETFVTQTSDKTRLGQRTRRGRG
jgi:hypothetical protein